MADTDLRLIHPPPQPVENKVPNAVLGTLIFILTEMMLFGGFISTFLVARSAAPAWPPPDQPRLPVEETAFNTVALLLSGALVYYAGRRFEDDPAKAKLPMLTGLLLGLFFVVFQGVEWVQLIGDGLTLQKSAHASFFFLIVGAHGVHVLGGALVLFNLWLRLQTNRLGGEAFWAGRVFWYFVVLLWPVLYYLVYLR